MRQLGVLTLAVAIAAGQTALRAEANGNGSMAAAFAQIKSLAGRWEATGGKAGAATVTYEVIADGSAVVERYASPKHGTMMTIYHFDGDRLLLTHYCVAKNQPRLQATAYDAAARELRFDFVDATNLKSSTAGHMHRAAFKFEGADRFVTEWSWQEDGKIAFTEKEQLTRAR
jgi:hypothetical protein